MHEVVAEVREFLKHKVHFFAECQAVNAYENTSPNPAWPFLDDAGRDGHFLTTPGVPPTCSAMSPCTDTNHQCVTGGCNDPNRCGDSDGDGSDDCAGGHFDVAKDCASASAEGGTLGTLVLIGLVGFVLVYRRRL